MGLVLNLKKKLGSLVNLVLVELSCLYIKVKVKQTMKKQDNSSFKMSLQSRLTMESQHFTIATSSVDTIKRITMEKNSQEIITHILDWVINRMDSMDEVDQIYDKLSLIDEYYEWLNFDENQKFEVITLDRIKKVEYDEIVDHKENID